MRWIVQSTRRLKDDARAVKKLSEKQLEFLNADYLSQLKAIKDAAANLKEGDLEFRIYRMEDAVRTLSNNESKSVDKLDAAFAIEQDSVVFNQAVKFHKGNNTWFKRPNLKDESLVSSVNSLMISGRKYGGDWQAKASLLKLAIHWWQRGRFGKGPENQGLLKSRMALKNEQEMFRLIMPVKMPKAVDPAKNRVVEYFPRRHLYNWATEYNKPLDEEKSHTKVRTRNSLTSGFV